MQFLSAFLDKLQKFFLNTIFKEQGVAMTELAKVRMLLANAEHTQFQDTMALSKYKLWW